MLLVRFDDLSEQRLLYVVLACALKAVFFKRTRPLRELPR